MDPNAAINFLIWLGVFVIVAVVLKYVLDFLGLEIPRIVWIVLGGIAGILILIWGARMLTGALG